MSALTKPVQSGAKAKPHINPYESGSFAGDPSSIARDIELQKKQYEEYLASQDADNEKQSGKNEKTGVVNPEFKNVFDFNTHKETVDRPQRIKEIQTLLQEIRAEIQDLKKRSDGLTGEIDQVEKAALGALPDRPGVYHVRYFEVLLQFLKGIKSKVGEARTWLQAMQSKKKKRGSAFVARSKKLGTQYSMSQELQASRNVM